MNARLSTLFTTLAFSGLAMAPLLSQAATLKPPEQTWSEYLRDFEGDTKGIDELVHAENRRTNESLKSSKNREFLNAAIAERFDRETEVQSQILNDRSELRLVDHGLGKATELLRRTPTSTQVLISNLAIKKNNSIAFVSFSVSPDQKLAIVFGAEGGSIDLYRLFVIDLEKAISVSNDLITKGNSVVWTGPEKFVFRAPADKRKRIEVDAGNGWAQSEYRDTTFSGNYPVVLKCENDEQKVLIENTQSVVLEGLTCDNWQARTRTRKNEVTIVTDGDHPQVLRYTFDQTALTAAPQKLFEFDGVLQKISFFDHHYFIQTAWGAEQKLLVLDENGALTTSWIVPSYASIMDIETKTSGRSVALTLTSQVVSDRVFEFDYLKGALNPAVTEYAMMTKTNSRYVSDLVMVPARDGVLLPVRLTRLASTKLTQQTPVLMDVYGGFEKAGKIYPKFSVFVRNLLLNRGGVYVTPAIRGGGEFGEAWYKSASGPNKITSLHDVIDVADYLAAQKWTSPSKLVITGTSNGGFTVTAAALLSPGSFGLVIPVSGVFDVLAINRLDASFAKGWWTDYGNPDLPESAAVIKNFSPLELEPSSKMPEFLFINGLNDSRVNRLHTLKMIKKWEMIFGASEKTHALFLKNSGHWIAQQSYGDYIALRENLVVWDFIYRFLGW